VTAVSQQLRISARQCYRLLARYRREGEHGLIHRLRGRHSNRGYDPQERQRIVALYRERYSDYGPTLFGEKIQQDLQQTIDAETLRRWLLAAGAWQRARRGLRHRKKRPRRSAIGALVQIDGSHHHWFEDRGPACCLFVCIDDASNRTFMYFAEAETELAGLVVLSQYLERYGIPEEIYTDRKNIYGANNRPSDFARAVAVLGVRMIYAHSPQAKGRVERANRTHQDRLVKALREANICTIEQGNAFLAQGYLDEHNQRFSHPDGLVDVHRPIGTRDLRNIVCRETRRFVHNDMTFQYRGTFYQILPTALQPLPRHTVIVRQWLDGSLHVFWREQQVPFKPCPQTPMRSVPVLPHPPESHPWRTKAPIGKAKRKTIKELCHTPTTKGRGTDHSCRKR
jgi:transposase